jgi:hypothetical protein
MVDDSQRGLAVRHGRDVDGGSRGARDVDPVEPDDISGQQYALVLMDTSLLPAGPLVGPGDVDGLQGQVPQRCLKLR